MAEFRHQKLSTEQNAQIDKFQETLPDKEVNVVKLAESFGVSVWRAAMPSGTSGMIRRKNGLYAIYANKYEPKARRRFTYAHELAHYLLHREYIGDGINESVLFRSNLSNMLEVEANKIAADILVPMRMLNGLAETRKYDVQELAQLFDVSRAVILVRLGIPEYHSSDDSIDKHSFGTEQIVVDNPSVLTPVENRKNQS